MKMTRKSKQFLRGLAPWVSNCHSCFLAAGPPLSHPAMADDLARPYKCTVQLALPSAQYTRHLRDVISVDKEISNKVVKSFSIERALPANDGSNDGDDMRVLRM